MAVKGINGPALGMTAAGVLFLWSGFTGRQVTQMLRSLLSGKGPGTSNDYPITAQLGATAADVAAAAAAAAAAGTAGSTGAGGTAAANKQIAKVLAASYGWSSGAEWDALVTLWEHESGWSNTADNPTSHAYGIPQALPASKMPKAAQPPSAGGSSDATAQIQWGLSYIKNRPGYGSPSAAWAFWQANGWY